MQGNRKEFDDGESEQNVGERSNLCLSRDDGFQHITHSRVVRLQVLRMQVHNVRIVITHMSEVARGTGLWHPLTPHAMAPRYPSRYGTPLPLTLWHPLPLTLWHPLTPHLHSIKQSSIITMQRDYSMWL